MKKYTFFWHQFQSVISILNRRENLNNLIKWAHRKHLQNPLRLYQNRLQDEEIRLNRSMLHYPRLTRCTCLFYALTAFSRPEPLYYRRGSAAQYRMKNLTKQNKQTYSYT